MSRWLSVTFNAVTDSETFSPKAFPKETFTVVWPGKCAGPPLSVNPFLAEVFASEASDGNRDDSATDTGACRSARSAGRASAHEGRLVAGHPACHARDRGGPRLFAPR